MFPLFLSASKRSSRALDCWAQADSQGFAPSWQLCCARPERLCCNCLHRIPSSHFKSVLRTQCPVGNPPALLLPAAPRLGRANWSRQGRKTGCFGGELLSSPLATAREQRVQGRVWISFIRAALLQEGWLTQLGFTQCYNSSSTSAASREQLRRCGQCGFMGRRWRARVSRWRCMGENGQTGAHVVWVQLGWDSTTCNATGLSCCVWPCSASTMKQFSRRQLPRLGCVPYIYRTLVASTPRGNKLFVLDQDGNPAKAQLLLKYSWQLPVRAQRGRLPQLEINSQY